MFFARKERGKKGGRKKKGKGDGNGANSSPKGNPGKPIDTTKARAKAIGNVKGESPR